jgi:hypothetical protein
MYVDVHPLKTAHRACVQAKLVFAQVIEFSLPGLTA